MKTYTALIRTSIQSSVRVVPTEIRAMSSADARWLLQAIFGFHSVLSVPIAVQESTTESATKSTTPEQQRIQSLKAAKDRASDALKIERARQSRLNATKTLQKLKLPK